MSLLGSVAKTFVKELKKVEAEKKGEAISQAVRLRTAKELKLTKPGRPEPTGHRFTDKRNQTFEYWTDGSVRRVK